MIMSSGGAETSRGVGAEVNRELTPTNSEDVSDCANLSFVIFVWRRIGIILCW